MKIEIEISLDEIRDIKLIKNYFGENDKTIFEHNAYTILNNLLKKLDKPISTTEV